MKFLDSLDFKPTHLYFLESHDISVLEMQRACFWLSLNRVIGKNLLDFCVTGCTSWFAVRSIKCNKKFHILLLNDI